MAYTKLKESINETIRRNGNQDITGPVLNMALTAIINTVGDGASFMGIANYTSNPGKPDRDVFYLANGDKPFSNFGGFTPKRDGLHILMWSASSGSWSGKTLVDFHEAKDYDSKVKVSVTKPLEGDGTLDNPILLPDYSHKVKSDEDTLSGDGTPSAPMRVKQVHVEAPLGGLGTQDQPLTSDTYSKKEADSLLDKKLDAEQYNSDKELQKEIDENQDKRIDDNRVKISENNQEINVIKDTLKHLNSNDEIQEAKGGSIINLPENAMKSVAPNYRIEGFTVQNLVKNGDLKEGTKGWGGYKTKITLDNGWIKTSHSEGLGPCFLQQDVPHFSKEDIVYQRCFVKTDSLEDLAITNNNFTPSTNTITINSNSGVKVLSVVGSKANDHFMISCTSTEVGFYAKNLVLYNLTQMFGAGNEPSKEWCDVNLPNYVEGTKSVQLPMRVNSVGENLFNYNIFNKFRPIYTKIDGTKIASGTTSAHSSMFQNIAGNTANKDPQKLYKVKANQKLYLYYKSDGKTISCSSHNNKGEHIESIYELKRNQYNKLMSYPFDWLLDIRFREGNTTIKDLQIVNYNKDDSDYTPYQESLAYFNDEVELKSIGGAKDYIENGKLYENIKRYYFSKEDEWTLREDYEGGNFRYYMTLPFDYKATGAGIEGEIFCNNFTPTSNVPSVLTERDSNTIALYRENASTLYLTLDKKVDNVNDVIPEGTFIDVILPQTEVSNLNKSGLITASPNGTIFLEPITNVTAYYKDGLDVSSINIVEIEEFNHMVDGVYEPLDVSKVKIEDNKLTHPDAKNGLVYLVYRYDDNPIYGESTISYYNNNRVLESPNGTFFKPVFSVDDEGNISMKGEKL